MKKEKLSESEEIKKCENHKEHEKHCGCGHSHSGEIKCSCCHGDDDGDEDEEEEHSLKKIIVSAVLFLLGLFTAHFGFFTKNIPLPENLLKIMPYASAAFCFVAFILAGLDVIKGAIKNIRKGNVFGEQLLMSVAAIGAIFVGEFPEAVAVMLFYQIGEFFQDYAVDKSRDSIKSLMDIRSDHANVIRDGKTVSISPEDVRIGEIIEVRPGERVPLDGFVIEGKSFVETSALTGESVPREVSAEEKSEILSGFVNETSPIKIQVTKEYGESAVVRILNLTEKASEVKARSEKFISKFAKVYTPIVCILAVAVAFIPPAALKLFAPEIYKNFGFSVWFYRALTFLVVSCPCALVISIPLSFFCGIGKSSAAGVLVKGSNFIEALAKVKIAVFDKTGTLTKGTFSVTEICPEEGFTKDELLAVATHAESYSDHPISKSLKKAHSCPLCGKLEILDAEVVSGKGIMATVGNQKILAGNAKLMQSENVENFHDIQKETAGTVIHVSVNSKYAGYIIISDTEKEDSKETISKLKKLNVKETVMLTGDSKSTAEIVGKKLGIDKVYADLLPEDKVSKVDRLISKLGKNSEERKSKLMFVGDGINDSPVLARADVGVAMGGLGSDAAIEAADVVIMDDKPSRLVDAIKIARKTMGVVYQNIVFSIGVKSLIMILNAAGIGNLWLAVFGDVGVCFIAILNAARLSKGKKKA